MWIDYFDKPTQVTLRFVNEGELVEYGAIAYRDEFIFGDDGGVTKIVDFYNIMADSITECRDMYDATGNIDWLTLIPKEFITVHYDYWKDISKKIRR